MNIFIIPSWYPSGIYPSTGIFFKEQALTLAKARPSWNIGICLWGSHDPRLWILGSEPLKGLVKVLTNPPLDSRDTSLKENCVEFFSPAMTWSRRIRDGNIHKIIRACEFNLERYYNRYGKPDLIHAHVSHPGGFIAAALSARHDIPFIITEHMSPFPMKSYLSDFNKWLIPPLKKANEVLAVSQHLISELSKYDIHAKLISNFIDDSFFGVSNTPSKSSTFVAVGRLESQKNYQLMLNAACLLKLQNKNFILKIIGSGTESTTLKGLAQDLGLGEYVRFLGECDRNEVRRHLSSSSVLLNTSLHENQPVAMLEALASGLPILTTEWKGASDFITPELGKIVGFDKEELCSEMLVFMNSFQSKENIRAAFDQCYGSSKVIDNLELIFNRLI